MKINKVVLYNFNSYEGFNEFDFSSKSEKKNIALIGGKNGAGKTSLFSAIKIALYGPLSFGYVGVNPVYISKIKDCINSESFQNDIVESWVQLSISLMIEREVREYEITRKWNYTKQKLEEHYFVKTDGNILDEQELSYFQNYLQGVLPPDLFKFFLFDGEEVGSIFSTSAYNTYIKNAVYKLCGLDTFEIIRKYTTGYAGKAAGSDEEVAHEEYEQLRTQVEELEQSSLELEAKTQEYEQDLERIETELIEVETAFKKAGGISETERQKLLQELSEEERAKTESLTKIKLFVEGLMPFFILRDFTADVSKQLELEEQSNIYGYILQKLDKTELEEVLASKQDVNDETVNTLMEFLTKKFKPKGFKEGSKPLHDLSKEDIGHVNAMISGVESFDVDAMVELIQKRKNALDRTMEINRILKSAMADEDARKYKEKENSLLKEKEEATKGLYETKMQLTEIKDRVASVTQQRDHALQMLKSNAQNRHVFELSSGIANMMSSVLVDKTESIKRKLEELIVEKLTKIYRKNNLITHIEVDDDFQFNLYQDARYSATELLHLVKNLGKEAFFVEIGQKGMQQLLDQCEANSLAEIQVFLESYDARKKLDLYKRIDISRLSKGERQIFILSLYWAIIELSGQDIPFVIDTPYARIDANHRKEISQKFFPNISKQVIILSTDEEINEEYYALLKPYISKEYLLLNDESQNKTSVEKRYFFEV